MLFEQALKHNIRYTEAMPLNITDQYYMLEVQYDGRCLLMPALYVHDVQPEGK